MLRESRVLSRKNRYLIKTDKIENHVNKYSLNFRNPEYESEWRLI